MKSVICVGIAVMDQVFQIKDLPVTAGKYFADHYLEVGGGPAATAAVTIAKLGGKVEFWGRVGADEIGDRIVKELQSYNVDTSYVRRIETSPSSISVVLVDQYGERLIVNRPVLDMDSDASWLPLERISYADAVLADSRWPEGAEAVLRKARLNNKPAILDADSTPDNQIQPLIDEASYVAFSENGLKSATRIDDIQGALLKIKKKYHKWLGMTMGEAGIYWIENEKLIQQAAFSVKVVDTLGAGDVFHGALALAIAEERKITDAICFANAAAALKCTQSGGRAGIPHYKEVEQLMKKEKR